MEEFKEIKLVSKVETEKEFNENYTKYLDLVETAIRAGLSSSDTNQRIPELKKRIRDYENEIIAIKQEIIKIGEDYSTHNYRDILLVEENF